MPLCCFGKKFDRKEFCDTVYYIGRPYRHRAIELIKVCQSFLADLDRSFNQDTELLSVIEECDKAISYAISSRFGMQESAESGHKFEEAIRYLSDYESKFHDIRSLRSDVNFRTVDERMRVATEEDERNKDKLRDESGDNTLKVVEFHILKTLPCKGPVIAKQALRSGADTTDLPEILWNFSHFEVKEYLTLKQNPHFYRNLPKSPKAYGGTFESGCLENPSPLPDKIVVPTNSSPRVYFNFPGYRRVFEVWKARKRDTLIFKDVRGNLQGETTVENSLVHHNPPFLYRSMQGLAEDAGMADNWRDPIRRAAEDTTRTHIFISPRV